MRKFLSTFIALIFSCGTTLPVHAIGGGGIDAAVAAAASVVGQAGGGVLSLANKKANFERDVKTRVKDKCELIKRQLNNELENKTVYSDNDNYEDLWKASKSHPDFKNLYYEFLNNEFYTKIAKQSLGHSKAGYYVNGKARKGKEFLESDDFHEECTKLVQNKIRSEKLEELIQNSNSLKQHNNSHSLRYIEEAGGGCNVINVVNGVPERQRVSCNTLKGAVEGENSSLMEVLSSISVLGVEKPYAIVGNNNYCNKCLKKAFKASKGGDKLNFQRAKKTLKEQLLDKLGTERVKAGFVKFASYLERVEKLNNLNDQTISKDNANDYYCIKELQESLTSNCGRGKLNSVLEELGVCKGSSCNSLDALAISKKFQEKISTRENVKNPACYTIKASQLQSTNSFQLLNEIFKVFKTEKYRNALVRLTEEFPNPKNEKKIDPYVKLSYAINEMGKRSSEFPEIADVYSYIQNEVTGLKISSENKNDVSETKIRSFFWKTFKDLPEVEFVFRDEDLFRTEFEKYSNIAKKDNATFLKYINENIAEKDNKVTKERISIYRDVACKELKASLDSGMCLNDKSDLNSFGAEDIAYAAGKLISDAGKVDNIIADTNKVALASVSCEMRNNLTSDDATLGDPANFLKYPSDYAKSISENISLKADDNLAKYGLICESEKGPHGSLETRKLALTSKNNGDAQELADQGKDAHDQHAGHIEDFAFTYAYQEVQNDLYVSPFTESNDYLCTDNFCGNTAQGSARSGGGQGITLPVFDFKPAGITLSEPTLPTELPEVVITAPALPPVSNGDVSSTNVSSTTGLETTNPLNNENAFSNESVGLNPFEGLMATQNNTNSSTPSFNSYSMNNYSIPQRKLSPAEEESRKETMKGIYKDFPDTFSSEQLEGLSNDQLEELLSFAKKKNNEDKVELEAEKAKFEEEKAKFEKEKIQAEIAELQKEKKKLLEENEVITRAPAANEGEDHSILRSNSTRDLTPKVETDKTVINNISQSADSYSRQAEIPSQAGQDNFNAGATSTSTTGVSGAMNSSTTGATIAALREYGTSYSTGGANTAEQVDSYLKYVQDNHVQASELVKRGPAGEVVELIIPNNKGELVSLDMASLSADERKKLEDKIEKLIALEGQASGIKLGTGAKVKVGSGVLFSQVKDIDEKIFELQNQYQETYLSDLKQQLLEAIIVKK